MTIRSARPLRIAAIAAAIFSLAGAAPADEPAGFAHWTADALAGIDAGLARHVEPDHSSRTTLADFGSHRLRMLYRDADGRPELHDAFIDVVVVESGRGTLQLGGTVVDKAQMVVDARPVAGEWVGTRLEGGERIALHRGDVLHIPARIPHAFLVPAGEHLTYLLLKIPG